MYVYHLKIRCIDITRSLPMRECGLKRDKYDEIIGEGQSLPMRECGLKQYPSPFCRQIAWSLPMRECGLKPQRLLGVNPDGSHSPCGSVD